MHVLAQALGLRIPPAAVAYVRPLVHGHLPSTLPHPFASRAFSGETLIRQEQRVLPHSRILSEQPRLEGGRTDTRRPRVNLVSARTAYTMASNGDIAHKRKASPVNIDSRPPKHLKPELVNILNGDTTPTNEEGDVYLREDGNPEEVMLPPVTAMADTAEWQATIEQVVKMVVSIHFCQTCSFDTDPAMSSEATGFVVDAKKGYILTNRHVVGAGPFWGYCIFDNHEEVGLYIFWPERGLLLISFASATFTPCIVTPSTISASFVLIQAKSNICPFQNSSCAQTLQKLVLRLGSWATMQARN